MNLTKTLLAAAALAMAGSAASAATVDIATIVNGDGIGNDCSGDFGTSPNCILQIDYDQDGKIDFETPMIAKIADDDKLPEVNGFFDTISGAEFAWNDDANTFTYVLGEGDPLLTHFSVKGGNDYTVYDGTFAEGEGYFTYDAETRTYTGFYFETDKSHILLFDSASPPPPPEVPLPAAGWLLLGGLGGLVAMRRRKS